MGLTAAACVVASGLIVGGSSASLALADPDKATTGDGAGAASGTGPGPAASQPGEATGQPVGGATGAPSTGAPGPAPVGSEDSEDSETGSKQPPSQVGNGRTGVESDGTGTVTGSIGASKQPEVPAEGVPQTGAPIPGELETDPTSVLPDDPEQGLGGEPGEAGEDGVGDGGTGGTGDTGGAGDQGIDGSGSPVTGVGEGPVDGELPQEPPLEGLPEADPAAVLRAAEGEEEPQQPEWCWWPFPTLPSLPDSGGGGGGATAPQSSIGSLLQIPRMQIPQLQVPPIQLPQLQLPLPIASELLAQLPTAIDIQPYIDAVTGLATAATELPFASITLPVIVPPAGVPGSVGGGSGAGGGGLTVGTGGVAPPPAGPRPGMPEAPRVTERPGGKPASPPQGTENPAEVPAFTAGNGSIPAPSYRAGYTDYLRAAGLGEVAAVAVPGVTGILALVGAGGLLGYRQARAGHTVRASGTGRFMS